MRKKDIKNTEKRREDILKAAEHCFLEKGLHQTNMRDIASEANLSLGNIYRYYKNKAALINAFMQAQNQEAIPLFVQLENTSFFITALKSILKLYYSDLSNPNKAALFVEIYAASLRNPEQYELEIFNSQLHSVLAQQLVKAEAAGKIKLTLSADATTKAILALTDEYATSQHLKSLPDLGFSELWKTIDHFFES